MNNILKVLVASICAPATVMLASAQAMPVIQGPPGDAAVGLASNIDVQQTADDFELNADSLLTGMRWWGNDFDGLGDIDDFTIRFLADDGGNPAVAPLAELTGLSVMEIDSGIVDDFGFAISQYDVVFDTSVLLTAGIYYISILNSFTSDIWLWSTFNGGGDNFFRTVDGDDWLSDPSGDLAFVLETTVVPLSPAWFYFFAGIGGIILARGRLAF